ncbi:hypothetical protein PG630_10720, partial [Riemerella anatipestifer]|nr:hypothetical protein [Riemerella anatipestifer]
ENPRLYKRSGSGVVKSSGLYFISCKSKKKSLKNFPGKEKKSIFAVSGEEDGGTAEEQPEEQ